MAVRYFIRVDSNDMPLALFRMRRDDERRKLFTEEWHDAWQDSPRLIGYLNTGDTRIIEVSAADANLAFPGVLD